MNEPTAVPVPIPKSEVVKLKDENEWSLEEIANKFNVNLEVIENLYNKQSITEVPKIEMELLLLRNCFETVSKQLNIISEQLSNQDMAIKKLQEQLDNQNEIFSQKILEHQTDIENHKICNKGGRRSSISNELKNQILELKNNGKSLREIANQLNVHYSSVARVLKQK